MSEEQARIAPPYDDSPTSVACGSSSSSSSRLLRILEELAGLVESGVLRVVVDQVLPLEHAAKAHELSETGHVTGKIVLTL